MKKLLILAIILIAAATISAELSESEAAFQKSPVYIRIERFPRPPYSGATYYIYERDGEVICTKLEVCNKYDQCGTEYKKGKYKDEIDARDRRSVRKGRSGRDSRKQAQKARLPDQVQANKIVFGYTRPDQINSEAGP
jgi:hypothetical protein